MKSRFGFIKILSLLVAFAVFLTFFTGCTGNTGTENEESNSTAAETQNTGTTVPAQNPVGLTMLATKSSLHEGVLAELDAVKNNLGITIEIDYLPEDGGANVVKTRIATNEMPDFFLFNSGALLSTLNPETNFVDITNEPFMANVEETFKEAVSVNGKAFGIPAYSSTVGAWLYNKKIYSELGLQVPRTWKELLGNCEKINAAGKVAIIGTYKDTWTAQLPVLADFYNVQALTPDFVDNYNNNRAKYTNTPSALRSFEKMADLKPYLNKEYLSTSYEEGQRMLAEGDGAHYPMLSQILPNIEEKYSDKVNDIGAFAQPSDDAAINGITTWMPEAFYLSKSCMEVDSAKKFMEYYVSSEGISIFLSKTKPMGPMLVKGVTLPSNVFPAVKEMMEYMNNGQSAPALEFSSSIKGPNLMQICIEVISGIKTAEQGAQEYDKDVEKQAKQLNMPGW